jgi:tetratricopeptide (TPR) repeat protein
MTEKIISTGEGDEEPAGEEQLDLFGQDRIRLGEGYAALARLDLDRAATIFNGFALENPAFGDAKQGFAMASAWSDILWDLETRGQQDAAVFLWEKIRTYDFGQWGNGLRKALIRKLTGLIGDAGFYVPPDLCLGFLFFELADYERSEDAYRSLLKISPNEARLLCRLGNSIYLQRRRTEARHHYVQALLASPRDVDPSMIEDAELRDIIKEYGVCPAPAYGWLRGLLPLIDLADIQATDEEHAKALAIYRAVLDAESARRKRDHRDMVEKRRNLKEVAPELFQEYIAFIA